jgi:XTP/dITP diphosphohydrolase
LTFVTGNKGKVHEATEALRPLGIEVVPHDAKPVEIQADTLEEISRAKCEVLIGKVDPPFIVDDGGLFVDALHGFPGVFSAHALKTLGVPGILKLMEGVEDRRARMDSVISLFEDDRITVFHGVAFGRITSTIHDAGKGFGYDCVFVPEGSTLTFAQMPDAIRPQFSHRAHALMRVVEHLRGTTEKR